MDYFDPHGDSISVFDVCEAYQLLEDNYNVDGWVRERPSNQRRKESIGCQLARIGYSSGCRSVDLWASAEEVEEELQISNDDESVRFVYFKKVLEWNLPIEDDDRRVIERIFTISAIAQWCPTYFASPPWRPVLLDEDPDTDFLDRNTWVLQRPVAGGRQTYRVMGNAVEFDSYLPASEHAWALNKELHDPIDQGS